MLSKSTDGYISRLINRRISNKITDFIINHELNLTPNEISLLSFSLGLLASILILMNRLIIGAILVQASSIVDGVDGELARAKGMASSKGAFIDAMLDRLADTFILISIIIYVFYNSQINLLLLLTGLLAITGSILVSYLHAACERSLKAHPIHLTRIPVIASRDIRLFIIFLLTLFGWITYVLPVLAIITYAYVILQLIAISIRSHNLLN